MNARLTWRRGFLLVAFLAVATIAGVAVSFPWLFEAVLSQESLRFAAPILYAISEPETQNVNITAVHFDSGATDKPDHDDRQRIVEVAEQAAKKHVNTVVYLGFNGKSISKSGKDFGCLVGQYQLRAVGDFRRVDTQKLAYRFLSRAIDLSPLVSQENILMGGGSYFYHAYLFDVKSGDIRNYACRTKTSEGETDFSRMSREMELTARFP